MKKAAHKPWDSFQKYFQVDAYHPVKGTAGLQQLTAHDRNFAF